jgi:hypothetical protein
MNILFVVQLIQAGIAVTPDIAKFVTEAKQFLDTLFGMGVITKAQQDAIAAHVDSLRDAYTANEPPPEYRVEPDPVP